jgi:hypothetical protein
MLLWRLGNKAIMWTERGQTALKHYYHGSCRAGRKDISWAWDSSDSCGRDRIRIRDSLEAISNTDGRT